MISESRGSTLGSEWSVQVSLGKSVVFSSGNVCRARSLNTVVSK